MPGCVAQMPAEWIDFPIRTVITVLPRVYIRSGTSELGMMPLQYNDSESQLIHC